MTWTLTETPEAAISDHPIKPDRPEPATPKWPARGLRWLCHLPYFKGKSRLERLFEFHVRLAGKRSWIRFPQGFCMELDPGNAFECGIFYRDGELDTGAFIRGFLKRGMRFADCGANIGFYSLLAAGLVGEEGVVYAFEPTPATFSRLKKHVETNGWSGRVRAFEQALGQNEGAAEIFELDASNHGMNSLSALGCGSIGATACSVATIDGLIARGEMVPPDLMKIDVEGSELGVLRGAQRLLSSARTPTLIIELSAATMGRFGYAPEDLVAHLLALRRYSIGWLCRGRVRPVDPRRPLPHYAVFGRDFSANYVFTPA